MRKLEEGRQRRREIHSLDRQRAYETFLLNQKSVWTPPELFEKCCPRFLGAGGDGQELFHSIRRKDGTWSCPGGCNKIHPTITLFFDTEKLHSVAILSVPLDPFNKYFNSRVKDGSAVCKTPFYYELDGFVRSNLNKLKEQKLFGNHLVKVAMGALRESDLAQSAALEKEHHKQCHAKRSFDRLEEVLQICRLHRLGEDLDVLSIHCMQKTSRVFRRVATPIAEQRMRVCQFVVTPLVDGYFLSGYSVFRRHQGATNTVVEREQGRMVEYAVSPSFLFHQDTETPGRFTARKNEKHLEDDRGNDEENLAQFSWACEELSFANLEREWGDIGVHEYVGQKVRVHWRRGEVDIPDQDCSTSTADMPVVDIRLNGAPQFSTSLFSLNLELQRMDATQVDEVTVCFEGQARIPEMWTSFEFLVACYSRNLENVLAARNEEILKTRPLLRHEQEFLKEVREIAAVATLYS